MCLWEKIVKHQVQIIFEIMDVYVDTPVNICENFKVIMNDGTTSLFNENKYDNRMVSEFIGL